MSSEGIPDPKPVPEVKILTDLEYIRFENLLKRLTAGDLEVLARMIWKARKEQYAQQDKSIKSGTPWEKK